MKNPVVRGLRALGLAPLGHVYEARARVQEGDLALRELKGRVDQLLRDLGTAREDLMRLRRETSAAAARQVEARQKLDEELREARQAARDWKKKAEDTVAHLRDLRGRLEAAERIEGQLRELLMLNETKLDLVEAAINVLDARTRGGGAGASR